jgi:hypothetical protein
LNRKESGYLLGRQEKRESGMRSGVRLTLLAAFGFVATIMATLLSWSIAPDEVRDPG